MNPTQYDKLKTVLYGIFGCEKAAERWFNEPNYEFGLLTPFDMWLIDKNKVITYVGIQFLEKLKKKIEQLPE